MRRWKQAMGVIVSFALVAAMLLPMSALAREQAIPTIRLTLGNGQTTPQYAAGETSELLIRVWNKGTQDAGNVKISPVLDDGASWPFEIADMNNELELGTIPAGQYAEAVWKDLKVRDDVETKSYKLAFTVTYDDGENQFQSTPYIFAKTTAKPEENQMTIITITMHSRKHRRSHRAAGKSGWWSDKHGSDHLRRRKWRWNFYCFSTASDRDRV